MRLDRARPAGHPFLELGQHLVIAKYRRFTLNSAVFAHLVFIVAGKPAACDLPARAVSTDTPAAAARPAGPRRRALAPQLGLRVVAERFAQLTQRISRVVLDEAARAWRLRSGSWRASDVFVAIASPWLAARRHFHHYSLGSSS